MEQFRFACPCGFGLESVLSGELKRLGMDEVAAADGRVDFTGTAEDLARANLWLRTAERVLLVLGSFRAVTFTQLFDGVAALPLERFIGKRDRFPVKGWSLNSQLHSVPDCQSIIKKAAVKRLGAQYGIQWFEETGALYQLQFSIHRDTVTIMLDTTGPGLHKRGYRRVQNQAPIRETLAAGILDLVRIYPDTRLYDPFCGSGTFLIEGAYKAKNIAPGLYRRFAAEHWGWIPGRVWREKREEALSAVRKDATFRAVGSDISPEALEISAGNAKKAGVAPMVETRLADIRDFTLPEERSVVVCNPPYGERLLGQSEAEELCRVMGRVFPPAEQVGYAVISSVEGFEELFGRPADKRRKLYNGMMKCQLYLYFPRRRGKAGD